MAQRLEVYRDGDGARSRGEKKGSGGNSKNKTKTGLLQWCRAMRRRKLSRWFSPNRRSRERARDVKGRRRRETREDSSKKNASTVEETIP